MNVMMNRIKYTAFLLLGLSLAACSQDLLGELASSNGDDNREIHFLQKKLSKEFKQTLKTGEFSVVLARNGNRGSYKVVLEKTGKDASLFSLEDTVVIADGKYSVEIPVTVDLSQMVPGSSAKASLSIVGRDATLGEDAAYMSQYSDFLDLSASFELEWEPYMRKTDSGEEVQQTATYYYSLFYTGYQSGIKVEKAVGTDNVFRLTDWAAGVPFVFRINSDNSVVVPGQSIGYLYESTNEYVQVSDIAQYMGDDSYYSTFPCTYDGKTFTLTLLYYVTEGIFNYGTETFVFNTEHDYDATVTAVYDGTGQFTFTFGDYTSYCRAMVVSGDITRNNLKLKEAEAALKAGTSEDVRSFTAEDNVQLWTPATEGDNTMLVMPFDEEGNAGAMVKMRFTYSADGSLMPMVREFTLGVSDDDPYTKGVFTLKTSKAYSISYIFMEMDLLNYFEAYYSLSDIASLGSTVSPDNLDKANGAEGVTLYESNLEEGAKYGFVAQITNSFGDYVFIRDSVTMKSHADVFQKKSFDDFIGAYLANAYVTTSSSSSSSSSTTASFRVDIIKTGDNTVSVKGLCNYSQYSPAITGTYIPEESVIRLNPQSLGAFNYLNVTFGFMSNLYSGIWSPDYYMDLGWADNGLVYLRTGENEAGIVLKGYKFMLFDGESFSGYSVGNKSYQSLRMQKL